MKLNSNCNPNSKKAIQMLAIMLQIYFIQVHVYILLHIQHKVEGALKVDYVCEVNCCGAETTCDAVDIEPSCHRDGILGFWTRAGADTYNQFLEANQVICDPPSFMNEKSLVFAGKDEKSKKFSIVISISQTFEDFSRESTIITIQIY